MHNLRALILCLFCIMVLATPAVAQARYMHLAEARDGWLGSNGDNDILGVGFTFFLWGGYYKTADNNYYERISYGTCSALLESYFPNSSATIYDKVVSNQCST